MSIRNRILPTFTRLVIAFSLPFAQAQEVQLAGTVRDLNTHNKISDVNVFVKGTQLGTSSDFAGRFQLKIPGATSQMIIVFHHVGYDQREMRLDSVKAMHNVYMQPRVIPLRGVEIEETKQQHLEIDKDLPQAISVIAAKDFQIRGYIDAGDLLKIDPSVHVEEDLSGRKTATIRGGNPDEVLVLYNGVKMNNAYDNIFDLSLIDLEDVERFEIIKGSNTALYGPDAFSGVINVVPRFQQDYNIRFQQRLGTYRSGNWGLNLYKRLDRLRGNYSFRRGRAERQFTGDSGALLENTSTHHTANLGYSFSGDPEAEGSDILNFMFLYTDLGYNNTRDNETLNDFNRLFSLKYSGDVASVRHVDLSVSFQNLDGNLNVINPQGARARRIDDRALNLDAEKRFISSKFDLLFGYQFKNNQLDYLDDIDGDFIQQRGLRSAVLNRQHHGLVGILKLYTENDSEFLRKFDVDLSMRYDNVHDTQDSTKLRDDSVPGEPETTTGYFDENHWSDTSMKLAINLAGNNSTLAFNGFISFGTSTKFPTLRQQVSTPIELTPAYASPTLQPERNRSLELGVLISRHLGDLGSIYGWELAGNFFQNYYENKFREFTRAGVPDPFYDNVPNARISGLETKASVFFFRKKVTTDVGVSRYSISEKAAFPFSSDLKRVVNFKIDHAGYSFLAHWFREGEQVALLRSASASSDTSPSEFFSEVILPAFTNLDLHLSKTFEFGRLKLFANASARNIINDSEIDLQGIAIRDRRYYITLGAQY